VPLEITLPAILVASEPIRESLAMRELGTGLFFGGWLIHP